MGAGRILVGARVALHVVADTITQGPDWQDIDGCKTISWQPMPTTKKD